jgi:hypothetical protein
MLRVAACQDAGCSVETLRLRNGESRLRQGRGDHRANDPTHDDGSLASTFSDLDGGSGQRPMLPDSKLVEASDFPYAFAVLPLFGVVKRTDSTIFSEPCRLHCKF